MIASESSPSAAVATELLLREAGGGIAFGLVLGYVTFRLLGTIDQYQVEVLLTLAAVLGGYALASHLHVSGPLAMVVAGLMIGNGGRPGDGWHHTPLRRHVLGAPRRDPECRALCPSRNGSAGDRFLLTSTDRRCCVDTHRPDSEMDHCRSSYYASWLRSSGFLRVHRGSSYGVDCEEVFP